MTKEKSRTPLGDMDSEDSFDSTGKTKSFRRLITRFSEKTSMQGPPYINMAKFWWAKLIWAILLLGAVAAMVLHLWYLFGQWYSWPKTTMISLGFDDLPFPQVTICNTNVLHKKRFDKFKGAAKLKMLVDDLKPENFVPQQFEDDYDPQVSQQDGNQLSGNDQGGNQLSGNDQGGNQLSGNDQGDSQQDGGSQDGQQQNGIQELPYSRTDQGGSQTTMNRGTVPGSTEAFPNEQGITQSKLVAESTSSGTRQDETQTRPNSGTTLAGSQSPPENTQSFRPTSPSGGETTSSSKKKGFNNYESLDLSKYYKNYKNYEDEAGIEDGLESPMDSQREIENVFRELYMNINKKNRMQLGHQIADMLVGCTFNGRQCPSDMFELHQTAEYGSCWTLASKKFTVRKSGPGGGLTIILFLETNEYLKGLTTGYGARVQFQERNTYPFPYDEGVFISGAMETDIGLKFRTIARLGGNYGTCNDGVEFRRLYNLTYTRRACQSFCRTTSVINTCSCFDDHWEEFAFRKNETLRPCRSKTEQTCKLDILKQYRNGKLRCRCDNPCREAEYLKSVSARQWPTNEYARVLLDWLCKKDPVTCRRLRKASDNISQIKNNFLKVNIYYEDLNFENITETAQIEVQQFLSDIGGAFGLWIGLSVLSLCEVVQLLIELFGYGVHKAVREQKADTDRRDKDITESPGVSVNNQEDIEDKLPRFEFDTVERIPRHVRDKSPYRERDRIPHTSERGSDDNLNKRKRDHDLLGRSPRLGLPRDRTILGSSPDLSNISERDSHNSPYQPRRHAHAHNSLKRARRQPRYSDFLDDYGLGREYINY